MHLRGQIQRKGSDHYLVISADSESAEPELIHHGYQDSSEACLPKYEGLVDEVDDRSGE